MQLSSLFDPNLAKSLLKQRERPFPAEYCPQARIKQAKRKCRESSHVKKELHWQNMLC